MLKDNLKEWFGFDEFKEGQEEIIDSVLHGRHTLEFYQLVAVKAYVINSYIYIRKPTLIISPLISLMDDQVMQMKLKGETHVACVHSGMDEVEKETILND